MKNILIIPPFNPYPLTSGGHQAIFNGIVILKDIANVYVFIEVTESQWKRGIGKEIETILPYVKVIPFIEPRSRHTFGWYCRGIIKKMSRIIHSRMGRFVDFYRDKPNYRYSIGINNYVCEEKIKCILHYVKKLNIDIVQMEMVGTLNIVEFLPSNIKKIFIHHELRFVRDELLLRIKANVSDEDKKAFVANKKEEIRLLNMCDNVVTLSEIDTNKLKDSGVISPITTSLAIVCDSIICENDEVAASKVLSYVGPENHYPNYEGVMWFLNNCWENLKCFDGEYEFQIIGKWSDETAERIRINYSGVKCVGYVNDLPDIVKGTVMIVPLNIGSGIRMKILEATQIGVPIVTTPVGAEGLPLVDNENAFITSDPGVFVEDILKLRDNSLRNKFVENARKSINDAYSFKNLKDSRISLYI